MNSEILNELDALRSELAAELRSRNKFRDEATELRGQVSQLREALKRVNRKPYRDEWMNEAAFVGAMTDYQFALETLNPNASVPVTSRGRWDTK